MNTGFKKIKETFTFKYSFSIKRSQLMSFSIVLMFTDDRHDAR